MTVKKCTCGDKPGEVCPVCGETERAAYWCEVCGRATPEKRCTLCGLKTKKIGGKGGGERGK